MAIRLCEGQINTSTRGPQIAHQHTCTILVFLVNFQSQLDSYLSFSCHAGGDVQGQLRPSTDCLPRARFTAILHTVITYNSKSIILALSTTNTHTHTPTSKIFMHIILCEVHRWCINTLRTAAMALALWAACSCVKITLRLHTHICGRSIDRASSYLRHSCFLS